MEQYASSVRRVRDALESACVIKVDGHAFAIFFKGAVQHVVGLNHSAETLVRLGLSGRTADELVAAYAAALDIPQEIAVQFISVLGDDWAHIGATGPDVADGGVAAGAEAPPPQTGKAPFDSTISIGGAAIRVVLHDPELAALTAPMVAGNDVPAPDGPIYSLQAWKSGGRWHLTDTLGATEEVDRISVARDCVLARIMANSWPALHDAPCIHGATLRAPSGRHVMLSGDSGRGKTTLALGLAKLSFTLLADDMSVFDAATGKVYPMTTNPSVKRGSWAALGALYPELALQEPVQVNGRLCKYITRGGVARTEPAHDVDALIFPKWLEGAAARLAPYESEASLLSMLRWSYLPQHQENLQAMADFLSRLPLYELTYSRFEEADELLLDLLECQT